MPEPFEVASSFWYNPIDDEVEVATDATCCTCAAVVGSDDRCGNPVEPEACCLRISKIFPMRSELLLPLLAVFESGNEGS